MSETKRKMIVLVGPPASGKSTWAAEFIKTHENTHVIVNRDSFRDGTGVYWLKNENNNRLREGYITKLEHTAIESAIEAGYTPIIDATNLSEKAKAYHQELKDKYDLEIEYKEFYVPFNVAVERDAERAKNGGHFCGKAVIKRFYQNYYKEQYEKETTKTVNHYRLGTSIGKPHAIMCDIDGTLAWMQGRNPYDQTKVLSDKCDEELANLISRIRSAGVMVIIMSGREGTEQCRRDTEEWMRNNCIGYDALFMRKAGDYRADEVVKRELFDEFVRDNYNVMCVFDDRNKVVNMWREVGLLCCQVADGDF